MNFPTKAFAAESVALFVGAVWARSSSLLASFDVQIHNMYFVLRPAIVCLGMALLLSLFAAVYSTVSLKFRFTQWHFWWTTVAVGGFWGSFVFFVWLSERGAASVHEPNAVLAMAFFALSTFAFLASPLMFVVNLGMALTQRHNAAHNRFQV